MNYAKTTQFGNAFLGLFACASDLIALLPKNCSDKLLNACNEVLGVEIARVSIANSEFIGLMAAMNDNGVILPTTIDSREASELKKLTGLNVCVSKSRWCALGNNLVANSHGCIASPLLSKTDVKEIQDCLGVEAVQSQIAGYSTVGSACIATNKGFVAHNDATDEELKFIESILKVSGLNATANMGVPFVGISMIANSKGCVVGEPTSGFELGRITQALSLF
ncbi:translation initiation factor IF-6 [Candidatus Micrarchaeota archaeon]|nr:translation initiation factor IF-6 [Candidatus Micrarchaeota archaeon]